MNDDKPNEIGSGDDLWEKLFESAGLPEVKEKDLETGTYTNRQVIDRVTGDGYFTLVEILEKLPPVSSPSEKRSLLRFAVDRAFPEIDKPDPARSGHEEQ